MYEAICGQPLSPYACRGKRAMNAVEMSKIGKWDQASLERALRHVDPKDQNSLQILRRLLHHNPNERYTTLRLALEHPFFSGDADDRVLVKREVSQGNNPISALESRPVRNVPNNKVAKNYRSLDLENSNNGISRSRESMSSVSKRFSQMMKKK